MAYRLKNLSESERSHFYQEAKMGRRSMVLQAFLSESDITHERVNVVLKKKFGPLLKHIDIVSMYNNGDCQEVRKNVYKFSFIL